MLLAHSRPAGKSGSIGWRRILNECSALGSKGFRWEPAAGKLTEKGKRGGGIGDPKAVGGYRRTEEEWVRSIRDQCLEGGVPFFFKQWGREKAEGRRKRSRRKNLG